MNKDSHCFSVRLFLRQMSEGSLDLCAYVLNWDSFSDQCFFFSYGDRMCYTNKSCNVVRIVLL